MEEIMQPAELKNIIASAGMGTWRIELIDGQQPRMIADEKMKQLLGIAGGEHTPEEVYAEWFGRIKPEAVDSVLASVARMQQCLVDENTYLWIHPTKGERYVRCGGTAEKTPGGFILRGYHYDVDAAARTEREKQQSLQEALRAAEAANQEIEAVHQALGSGDWRMHFDENGDMTACNWSHEFRNMLGYTSLEDFPDELESWSDLLHPEDKERVLNHYWDVVHDRTGEKTYNIEYRLATKNRGERWFRAVGRLTRRPDGTPVTFYGIFLDIDDDKRRELAEKNRMSTILEAVSREYHTMWLITKADLAMHFIRSSGVTTIQNAVNMGRGNANYDKAITQYINTYIVEDDRERVAERVSSAAVMREVQQRPLYTVNYKRRDDAGHVAYHQMAFADTGEGFILAYRDVDAMIREELEAQEARHREQEETAGLINALGSVYVDVILVDLDKGTAKPIKLDAVGGALDGGYYAGKNRPYSMQNYVRDFVHPEDRAGFDPVLTIEDCRAFFAHQSSYSFEYRSVRDGETHYVQVQMVRPNPDSDEVVVGYKNIDEQEAERMEKTRQEHELLGVIEALSSEYSSLFLLNAGENTYRTIRTNDIGSSLTAEYANAEAGLHSYVDGYVFPEDREKMHQACTISYMDEVVPETGVYSVGYRQLGGENLSYGQMNIARFTADDGAAYFVIGMRDITKVVQKELETQRALQEAYDVAEAANHAKSDFLQTMSHDIRTPMNGIIGMTAIAAAHINDKERVQDSLQKITHASRHLLSLINEVLDMSKIESGKVSLAEEEFNLSDLIDNLLTMVRPQIAEHEHELTVNIQAVDHELVVGDALHIQQAFVNLMSNAIKYTPNGGRINLSIREIPCNQQRVGCYEFVFADNGIGMTEEYMAHIFEPFTRAEDGRISKIQGTGLGMPITKNIVNMMGGDIEVESRLNEGTTFTVTIFLKLQDTDTAYNEKFADLPVLVADDDEMSMESAVSILEELGMKAEGVLSGEAAVEKVTAHHRAHQDYHAVVLDWKMPGMDGVETAKAIRAEVGKTVPIIILSAYDWTDIEEEARAAGVTAFISKPLFKSRLRRVFSELVGDETEKPEETQIESPLQELEDMDLSAFRCLLAEDNELNAEIAVEILSETGMTVDHVWDGAEAVEAVTAAEDGKYDLVLMDIQMPRMNGYDAARAIRANSRTYCKTVPIIAMTANAFAEDVQAARTAGMNGHIAKPLDLNVLAGVLQKLLLGRDGSNEG